MRSYRPACAGDAVPDDLATFDGEMVVCALHQFCAEPASDVARPCALEPGLRPR